MRMIIIAGAWLALAACSQDAPPAQVDQPAPEAGEDMLYATTPVEPMARGDVQVIEQAPEDMEGTATGTLVTEEAIDEPAPASASAPGVLQLAQASTAPSNGRFREGRHFQRLSPSQPTSSGPDTIEVAEVFWYGCPHCYEFEPFVRNWKQNAPEGVTVVGIPATWNPLLLLHARAYYTAEHLGVLDELHMAIFREYHERRNPLDSEGRIREFFGSQGVSGEDFDRAWNSFNVQSRLQRAEQMARRYRVNGVPMIVVNGKYTVDGRSAGGLRQMLDVAEELVEREKAAR